MPRLSHPPPTQATAPRIALQVDTSTGYSAALIRGIVRYVREHGRWELLVQTRGARERWRIPAQWQAEGVIARVTRLSQARDLDRLGVPVVNVSRSRVPGFPFPQVTVDEEAIGGWAANHLLERGFTHFAYLGMSTQDYYTDASGPAFRRRLAARGFSADSFRPFSRGGRGREEPTLEILQRWVRSLPDRVGVFVNGIEDAFALAEACRSCQRPVPDSLAILCGEDDPLLSIIAAPTLSCIDLDPHRVGYVAADLLARLLESRRDSSEGRSPRHVVPCGITERRSTATYAFIDQDVSQALRFIHDTAQGPIDVSDVLRHVAISRRALEQRFRKLVGRTPAAEIRRVRLERVKELLRTTDWPMPKIARAAGFSGAEVMNQIFRRELRRTPTDYRRSSRAHVTGD